MTSPVDSDKPIILYDGVCNLCTQSVQFLIQRDSRKQFRFASLQSSVADHYLKDTYQNQNQDRLGSMALVVNEHVYLRSTAALMIAKRLDGFWPILAIFLLIPRPIRDLFYKWVANHRYEFLGKEDQCWKPAPELTDRFLDS